MAELQLRFEYDNAYCKRENAIPIFLRSQGVKGSLQVQRGSSQSINKIKIVLRGTLTNSLGHHNECAASYQPHRLTATNSLLNLVEAHDWPSSESTNAAPPKDTQAFSFDFPLYRKQYDPHESVTNSTTLLPSTISASGYGCRAPANRFSCSAVTQVRYQLEAYAFNHTDEVIDSAVSTINIFDSEDASPPPVFQEHFKGEYVCVKNKFLRTLGFRGPELTFSVAEPKPIEIRPKTGAAFAEVPIHLCLKSKSKRRQKYKVAPRMKLRVASMLKTSTYMSVGKMEAQPTLATTQQSPFLASLNKFSGRTIRNLVVDDLKVSSEGCWTTDIKVLLPIAENHFPAPSFFTPYLARRYSLALRFDVKSRWGNSVARLVVPVQIVYPQNPITYEQICDEELDSNYCTPIFEYLEMPPIYIR